MALTELAGKELGTQTVVIERGPLQAFARAVTDQSKDYAAPDAPVPATFPFAFPYWARGERSGLPIGDLRGPGRMILHGEQEFVYHRWPRVGDVLEGTQRVREVYEKESGNAVMEFYVAETSWRDAESGEPVVDTVFTLIVRDTNPR